MRIKYFAIIKLKDGQSKNEEMFGYRIVSLLLHNSKFMLIVLYYCTFPKNSVTWKHHGRKILVGVITFSVSSGIRHGLYNRYIILKRVGQYFFYTEYFMYLTWFYSVHSFPGIRIGFRIRIDESQRETKYLILNTSRIII